MSTRTSSLVVLLLTGLCVLAVPAFASKVEADADPVAVVAELARVIQDPDSAWKARWNAYSAAKAAIGDAKTTAQQAAQEAYLAIQPDVAKAIRRTNLTPSAWIMAFVGTVLLWGGFAFHLGIARRSPGEG